MCSSRAIYVVGAQCSGKTSLVKGLKQELESLMPVYTITEAARDVLRQHDFSRDDIRNDAVRCLALQKLILQAQSRAESDIQPGNLLLSDRSGIDPIVYATKYGRVGASQELTSSLAWVKLRERMASTSSLVVLCEPVVDWLKDDGTRLMPVSVEEWMELHQCFCDALDKNGIRYHLLRASITSASDRIAFVLELFRGKDERTVGNGTGESSIN